MSNVEKKAKKKTKMSRINIRISSVLNDWLDEQTRLTGVPKSTICHLAIMNYVQQQQTVELWLILLRKWKKERYAPLELWLILLRKWKKERYAPLETGKLEKFFVGSL